MSTQTEAALDALLNLITNAAPGTFPTTGRRLKFWSDLSEFPALFVRHTGNNYTWPGEGQPRVEIEADIRIFTKEGENPDAVPDTSLNTLVTLVEQALQPGAQDEAYQTLRTIAAPNGLVYYARIEGHAEFWPGDVDAMAEATIPVRIMLP